MFHFNLDTGTSWRIYCKWWNWYCWYVMIPSCCLSSSTDSSKGKIKVAATVGEHLNSQTSSVILLIISHLISAARGGRRVHARSQASSPLHLSRTTVSPPVILGNRAEPPPRETRNGKYGKSRNKCKFAAWELFKYEIGWIILELWHCNVRCPSNYPKCGHPELRIRHTGTSQHADTQSLHDMNR